MVTDINAYRRLLEANGPAGLDHLNERVAHRYTGVYQLCDGNLRNLYLFDKRGEARPEFLEVVPLADSFCQFVLRDGVFLTDDSGKDERLNGHKYQGALLAYHGVPLLNNRGELFGTLCHFDADSHQLRDDELAYLHQAARLLPAFMKEAA